MHSQPKAIQDFLSPTDEQNTQFCYHPLLAHGLQVLLQRETTQLRATLHSRASDWYAAHGDELEAIGHVHLSGDERRLADRIGQAYGTLILRGELITLIRLLESVPEELTDNYSHVALAYAWSHITSFSSALWSAISALPRWRSRLRRRAKWSAEAFKLSACEMALDSVNV